MGAQFYRKYSKQEVHAAFKYPHFFSDKYSLHFTMILSHFDRDGDGFITCDELYDVFTKMGRNYSDKEIKRMIKAIDTDGIRNLNFM